MITEKEQNKSASYAIEMMLKLSKCFEQMSSICRIAVIDFTKEIRLKDEFQNIVKYRIGDEPKRQAFIQKTVQNIEKQIKKVQENLSNNTILSSHKTKSTIPKKPVPLQSVSIHSVDIQNQEKNLIQKQQRNEKISKPKDIIIQQKKVPLIEEKRVVRQNRKIYPKVTLQQGSSQSSQPSDYKSRHKKRSDKSRSKQSRVKGVKNSSKKKPANGFINFFIDIKDQIKEKFKVKTVPELSHFASIEWKKLSPEEQQKYNNMYYENLEKMKTGQRGENQPIQLGQTGLKRKERRTYRKVKRPQKESPTQNENESSSSSGTSSSGNGSSDSNNSQSSTPSESSHLKKKSKKGVIMKDKDGKQGKQFKIQLIKQ